MRKKEFMVHAKKQILWWSYNHFIDNDKFHLEKKGGKKEKLNGFLDSLSWIHFVIIIVENHWIKFQFILCFISLFKAKYYFHWIFSEVKINKKMSFHCHYSCNNITTTLIQISRLFYFGFFSKINHQMMI